MKTLIYILAVVMAGSVLADSTFTIGAGTGPECDMTFINQAAATTNYGTSTGAYCYDSVGGGANVNLLFRWHALADSLNKGVLVYIKACTLLVKSNQLAIDNPTQGVVKIARTRRSPVSDPLSYWEEVSATWNRYKVVTNWTTAGARSTTGDIDTSAMSSVNFATTPFGSDSVLKIDITAPAQLMDAADTANAHCGFIMFAPWWGSFTTQAEIVLIATDDHATAANRPKLKVVYTRAVQPPVGATHNRTRRTANSTRNQ